MGSNPTPSASQPFAVVRLRPINYCKIIYLGENCGCARTRAKRANEALGAALTKESLSIAADNYLESLATVRKKVNEGVKIARLAA